MPYAPLELILRAVESLEGANPLAVVSVPALLRTAKLADVDPVADGVAFGSAEETQLLDSYFTLPRPPDADRPWRAPWSAREKWQKRKYAGGGLQRLRTDASARGRVLRQVKNAAGPHRDLWHLTPNAGAELQGTDPRVGSVRVVDLALWFGREQDVADLDGLIAWFHDTFRPDFAGLLDSVYQQDVPDHYRQVPFALQPLDDDDVEQLGSLPIAPTVQGTLVDLVTKLEHRLSNDGFELSAGLVRRVLTAWLRGDIVVLVGQPGTGKTLFADSLGRGMQIELGLDAPLVIPVRADFDESEFIGYERLDGTAQLREFATNVLQTQSPLEARVVVLEEFNLASVETYLASVLVATQGSERIVRMPAGQTSQLPVDTFIIATCNSYRDEPETRTRVSSPTKRRSTIITMPNVLGDQYDEDPDNAVLNLSLGLIQAEGRRIASRSAANGGAQFDALRAAAISGVTSFDVLSAAVRDALVAVTDAILSTSPGRAWFTMGLLRDVVLQIAHAERTEAAELEALGQAVADKLLHQVRGTHADVQDLEAACANLPNADEIARLLDRMRDGPADELLPLV